jgi:hypothetical protein
MAGNQRGASLGTILQNFQEIAAFCQHQVGQAPVIKDEKLSLPQGL